MFRRGGQANGGITTGLGRQRYDNGGQTGMERIQRDLQIIDQLAPQRGGALNDFMINFGLNMVGNPPKWKHISNRSTSSTRTFRTISTNKSQRKSRT